MLNQIIESAENQSGSRQSNKTSEKAPQAVAKAKNSATRFSEHAVLIAFSHFKKKSLCVCLEKAEYRFHSAVLKSKELFHAIWQKVKFNTILI
jgi:hypothetical protein